MPYKQNLVKKAMFVALMGVALTGCGAHPKGDFTARTLPPLPSYAQTVSTPRPQTTEALLLVVAREKTAKDEMNRRMIRLISWYAALKKSYATGKAN